VKVFEPNFLASMLNWSRRTTRIRPESSWSGEHAGGAMMLRFASDARRGWKYTEERKGE
jgi:hypothetical protein